MAKILSGGMIGEEKTTLPTPSRPVEETESWLPYLGRNIIAKAPTYAYEAARTGLGIGNLLEPLTRAIIPQPEWNLEGLKKLPYGKNAQPVDFMHLLPFVSQQTARQEAASVLPNVMTETRPGDPWAELLMSQALPLGLAKPKTLTDALQMLGAYTGGYYGGKTAQAYAPRLTSNKDIQEALTQLGGMGGARVGSFAGGLVGKIPTNKLAPEVLIDTLREQQGPAYEAAIALEGDKIGDSSRLLKKLNKINDNLGLGMSKTDKGIALEALSDIEQASMNGLPLAQAKIAIKNLNSRIYDRSTNDALKPHLHDIKEALTDFIKETGSPEHNKEYFKAQKTSRDIFDLEKKIQQASKDKESLAGVFKDAVKKYTLPMGIGSLAKMFGFDNKAVAIAGLLSSGARRIFLEGKYLHQISKEYPDIFNKYVNTLIQAPKMSPEKAALRINNIAKSLEEYYPEEEQTESGPQIVSGGLID